MGLGYDKCTGSLFSQRVGSLVCRGSGSQGPAKLLPPSVSELPSAASLPRHLSSALPAVYGSVNPAALPPSWALSKGPEGTETL